MAGSAAAGCRCYVGNLPRDVTEGELGEPFRRFGRVTNIWIARQPHGFAFVDFEDPRDASDAVKELDGAKVAGNRVKCEIARNAGRRPPPPGVGGGGRGGFGRGDSGFGRGGDGGDGGYGRGGGGGDGGYGRGGGGGYGGGSGGGYRGRSRSPVRGRSRSPVRDRSSRSPVRRDDDRDRDRDRGRGRDRSRSRSRSPRDKVAEPPRRDASPPPDRLGDRRGRSPSE